MNYESVTGISIEGSCGYPSASGVFSRYGFIEGEPPDDGKERVAVFFGYRRDSVDYGGPDALVRFGEVKLGYRTGGCIGFMNQDGWIGWSGIFIAYHPEPVKFRGHHDWEKWLLDLESVIPKQ